MKLTNQFNLTMIITKFLRDVQNVIFNVISKFHGGMSTDDEAVAPQTLPNLLS